MVLSFFSIKFEQGEMMTASKGARKNNYRHKEQRFLLTVHSITVKVHYISYCPDLSLTTEGCWESDHITTL